MKQVQIAIDADCIATASCGNIKLMRPRIKRTVRTAWGDKERQFVSVQTRKGIFLADINTGQLYREDGVCLTSMILRMLPP